MPVCGGKAMVEILQAGSKAIQSEPTKHSEGYLRELARKLAEDDDPFDRSNRQRLKYKHDDAS